MDVVAANSECLRLNKEIAYKGTIGRRRQDFCVDYINKKKTIIKEMEQEIITQIEDGGETITCQKGCSSCCVAYVEANLSECEAIVYYLYQNEDVLSSFLAQYPLWREKIRQYGDLFKRCEQVLGEIRENGEEEKIQQDLADALFLYKMQNIPCPFLSDHVCTIHEVRPFTCASHYVTTPSEWCSPLNPKQPKVYKSSATNKISDQAYYYGSLTNPVILYMPMAVYEILKCGFFYLSKVICLEGLQDDVMNDSEITAAMQQYHK